MTDALAAEQTAKHTPGPWEAKRERIEVPAHDGWFLYGQCDDEGATYHVGSICDCNGAGENAANARLIAAAPELLEAVKEIVKGFDTQPGFFEATKARLRAVIAKAEGR